MSQKKLGCIISLLLFAVSSAFFAQPKKDTLLFSKYSAQINFGSRILIWSVGFDRLEKISEKLKYSSQINFVGGIANDRFGIGKQTLYTPRFVGLSFQPFHLLVGKDLQFETGPSLGFSFYRLNGRKYPLDTTNNAYNSLRDRFELYYLLGGRYTLPKQQISFKFLVGIKYTTSMFNYNINRIFGCFESSILYTFRKKVYKKKYFNDLKNKEEK